jgi:membrane protein YqaA with SNARE-associated domain
MLSAHITTSLWLFATNPIWKWFHRLGGPGLILLGLIDNSAIPIPGGMDVFVILLAAHHRPWWPYYAFMATVGAVVGGYLTYRLAEKGGEETLEKKIGKQRAEKVYKRFEKRGFATISVSAIIPPPFPMVPVLLAAGALKYPRKKFLAALATGRGVRFFAIAYLAHIYGKAIIGWLCQYYAPLLYALLGLAVLGAIATLLYFKWYRPKRQKEERKRGELVEEFPIPYHKNQKQKAK